ncbi:MAG: pilus assembly protein PilM [Mogibacterium sp.]|nr:pilus assembly protein PilM [Mogibacterium sp.]
MAKKTILGIDVGADQLKMVLVDNNVVLDAVAVSMPENLLKEGRITSIETLSDLIARTMKENGIKARNAAYVLSNETVFIKNVRMPLMTTEQLAYNLPFEFSDYITGEIKDYVFDYAVLPPDKKDEPEENESPSGTPVTKEDAQTETPAEEETLDLMAVGAERAVIEEIEAMLQKTGLRLVKTAPAICSYISLIREQYKLLSEYSTEFCILDLGYDSIRMYIYDKDRHEATRVLDMGLSALDDVLADMFSVERHLAHTYLLSNFENCLEREECRTTYENIAVELMRAMNFYRFSNPDSSLTDMWLCGGGAAIGPLTTAIGEMLDMRLHTASELVPDGEEIPNCNTFVQAAGIATES